MVVTLAAVLLQNHSVALEARRLHGEELLKNLRGYLNVERVAEAVQVLDSLEKEVDLDYLDQARYEVARAYVAQNKGELAIPLLDKITLHDRSFEFQRAVLREKLRGLFSFFFDASGDLRTPAQLDDYLFHSKYNPDEKLRPKNPAGFDDPNKLLDYYDTVASQIERILEIQGLERQAELALVETYDAIQILLYGRGIIKHNELLERLASSASGKSARTLYLLGNQYFVEADYALAFETWGELLSRYPESDGAMRAFSKTFELFEAREMLKKAFAFWLMQKPEWLDRLAAQPKFKAEASKVREQLSSHQDIAKYKDVTRAGVTEIETKEEKVTVTEVADVEAVVHEPEQPEALGLERDRSLGWRLQTEFREFFIARCGGPDSENIKAAISLDTKVFSPSEKKPIKVQTSYYGEVRFCALSFADGDEYRKFNQLDEAEAVQVAAGLPEAKSWIEDLGPLSSNGKNTTKQVYVPLEEPGFYLITARARYVPVVSVTQIAVVSNKVLTWTSPDGVLFRVVERESGKPIPQAKIHGKTRPLYDLATIVPDYFDGTRTERFLSGLRLGFTEGKRDELTTDSDDFLAGFNEGLKLREKFPQTPEDFEVVSGQDGLASIAVPERWKGVSCQVEAKLDNLGDTCPISVSCGRSKDNPKWQALFYAERPIFQPGEKARVKGILRKLGDAGLALPGSDELEFMLWHTGRLYGVVRAKPNEAGTVQLEYQIPVDASLGAYHVTIGHEGTQYSAFRVDRGEKPLLDVTVKPDADLIFAGSTIRGRVTAHRAGYVAAAGVPVSLKVYRGDPPAIGKPYDEREDFFQPVKLQEYPDMPGVEMLKASWLGMPEVWSVKGVTDSNGEYPFNFESDKGKIVRYLIVARVQSLPKRFVVASAEVLSNDLPVFLQVSPERAFYYPGETLRAEVVTRSLDGSPVAVSLRAEIETPETNRTVTKTLNIKTDQNGKASLSIALGQRKPSVKIGVMGTSGWQYRDVDFTLKQIGAEGSGQGIVLKLDRKAYYPGETARITIQVDRAGADVMLTLSQDKVRYSRQFIIEGSTGTFDVPIKETDAPNIYFHAVSVWNDQVRTASLEIPVVPAHKFLKVEVETEQQEFTGGEPVSATVKVTDYKGTAVAGAEVSLAAVLSSAFVLQEDLTPDLARYFHSYRLPLMVQLGGSALRGDTPSSRSFWLKPTFAWGTYSVGWIGVGGGGAGLFGYRTGGGRKATLRGGGGASDTEGVDTFAEFLRQHGLTLFYEARLVTDKDGLAKVQFIVPRGCGEFRFTARALTSETLVGEIRRTVRFRQDLYLQVPWPVNIREGESIRTPVFVVNATEQTQNGQLSVSSDFPIRIVSGSTDVEVPPAGVQKIDVEIDATALPQVLKDKPSGQFYPISFAKFEAILAQPGGRKFSTAAMIPVHASGIPVERVVVTLAHASEKSKEIQLNLEKAMPDSALVTLRPLGDPMETARWLVEELKLRMENNAGDAYCYTWASEALAERLSARDIEAGKTLKVEAPLVSALSDGVWGTYGEGRAPFLLSYASAQARGVRLPTGWPENMFSEMVREASKEKMGARELWALVEYAAGKEEKAAMLQQVIQRAEEMSGQSQTPSGRTDSSYLALVYEKLNRRTQASWHQENALSAISFKRRERGMLLPLEESAALLLAGCRTGLDTEALGLLYGQVLDSLANEPRPTGWAAALAVHALRAWSEQYTLPAGPLKVNVEGHDLSLQAGSQTTCALQAGSLAKVTIQPPQQGIVALEVVCSYRIRYEEFVKTISKETAEKYGMKRLFARLDSDGNAELIEPGDAIRIGEALMMLIEATSPGRTQVVVPFAGPWAPVPQWRAAVPTKLVKKEFVLSRERREHVFAAVEENRIEDARGEILDAVQNGDYLTESVPIDKEVVSRDTRMLSMGSDPAVFSALGKMILLFRPDRTGSFVAPAPYIQASDGAPPVAAAPPFAFRVVEADTTLPPKEAELNISRSVREVVAEGFKLIPGDFLNKMLSKRTAFVDLRPILVEGLFHSTAPEAPEVYARLSWANDGASLKVIGEFMSIRDGSEPDADWVEGISGAMLKRALESEEIIKRLAGGGDLTGLPVDEGGWAISEVKSMLDAENEWRLRLYAASGTARAMDGVLLKLLNLGQVLIAMMESRRLQVYDAVDSHVPYEVDKSVVRGPSLQAAIREWAESFGLTAKFAQGIPDLVSGEFVLLLPELPSTNSLNRSLSGICLQARRKGTEILVSVDRNATFLRPEIGAVLEAKTPEDRLNAFLSKWTPGSAEAFKSAIALWAGETPDGGTTYGQSAYTPRVEAPRGLLTEDYIQNLPIDGNRPLGEQLHVLSANGLRLETDGGLLRFVLIK